MVNVFIHLIRRIYYNLNQKTCLKIKDIYVSVVNCQDKIHNVHVYIYIMLIALNQMLKRTNMVHMFDDS